MTSAILTLLLGVAAILVIIAANAYFVAQEFAYMSVDRIKLGAQARAGDEAAKRAVTVTRRTSFMLSGAQLGITVTGLLVGYVAEPLVGESLGELLGGAGVPTAMGISVGTTVALIVATVVQMIFAELFPKNLAIANPEPLARRMARSTLIYLKAFGWLITVFDHASNALLKLVGIEPVHDLDTSATTEDLKHAVADSRESGDLPVELSILIDRVLEFPDQDVDHAMIPRSQVATVTPETTLAELRTVMAGGHSRYPVVGENEDPVGVVHLVDVLRGTEDASAPVTRIMRPPVVVPTSMPLPDALAELTGAQHQLACVIDEYGGFVGILTAEDLGEELVGEITDEHDEAPPTIVAESAGVWRIDGDLPIDEVRRAIEYELPTGDYETIAGLIIDHLGALPESGETVRVAIPDEPAELVLDEPVHRALDIEVLALSRRVPSEVRATLVESGAPSNGADGADSTDGAERDEGER